MTDKNAMTNEEVKTGIENLKFTMAMILFDPQTGKDKTYEMLNGDDRATYDGCVCGIEALEKQEKYKWHDLRKNPEDLPTVEHEVDIVCEKRNQWDDRKSIIRTHGFYEDGTMSEYDSEWNWQDIEGEYNEEEDCYMVPKGWWEYRHYLYYEEYNNAIDDFVIAWREIDPFEEEYEGDNE